MKPYSCFIDTGAYFAAFFPKDNYHQQSLEIWESIENSDIKIITSNHILDELATLLARKTNYSFAASQLKAIYTDSKIHIERSNHADELQALSFFQKYSDQKISFTDCISFAIMKRLNITQIFTFDQHFEYLGFNLITNKIVNKKTFDN